VKSESGVKPLLLTISFASLWLVSAHLYPCHISCPFTSSASHCFMYKDHSRYILTTAEDGCIQSQFVTLESFNLKPGKCPRLTAFLNFPIWTETAVLGVIWTFSSVLRHPLDAPFPLTVHYISGCALRLSNCSRCPPDHVVLWASLFSK
jgi:hypothetical protein